MRALAWSAGVGLFAALNLLLHSANLDPSRLHLGGNFIDQAGYITTARDLLETGELKSALIYPAYLELPAWRLYMPGHYLALAASYATLGYGVLPSLLPSLASFVVGCVAVFWIARRTYGIRAACASTILFAAFPGTVTYAFTAMAELTFTGACALALLAFTLLPARLRPWAMPALLAGPFLFRETGALYALPMAALILLPLGKRRLLISAAAALASALVLFALYRWQVASGKGTIPLSWVTQSGFNYSDAVAPPPPELSLSEWARGILANFRRNVLIAVENATTVYVMPPVQGLVLLVASGFLSLLVAAARRGRDAFALGAGLLGVSTALLLFCLYDVTGEKGMRSLLFTAPALAVVAGSLVPLRPWGTARLPRALQAVTLSLAAIALLHWSHAKTVHAGARMRRFDLATDASTQVLRAVGHDPRTLLVSHAPISMRYVVDHYPVRWSFIPANDESLRRLIRIHGSIGTLVMPEDYLNRRLSSAALERCQLQHARKIPFHDRTYLVYKSGN